MLFLHYVAQGIYRAAMAAGHLVCHQIAARSPHLFGWQLPLCWRCTGIACGALFFLAAFIARRRTFPLVLSVTLALLMPFDVMVNSLGFDHAANARRLITGLLWGFFALNAALVILRNAQKSFGAAKNFHRETRAH